MRKKLPNLKRLTSLIDEIGELYKDATYAFDAVKGLGGIGKEAVKFRAKHVPAPKTPSSYGPGLIEQGSKTHPKRTKKRHNRQSKLRYPSRKHKRTETSRNPVLDFGDVSFDWSPREQTHSDWSAAKKRSYLKKKSSHQYLGSWINKAKSYSNYYRKKSRSSWYKGGKKRKSTNWYKGRRYYKRKRWYK